MSNIWKMGFIAALALAPTPAFAAQDAAAFHAEIAKLYDFPIGKLSNEKMVEKSGELDVFWKKVEKEKAAYLPMLRKELTNTANPPFFAFDGASLLRSISEDRADRQLALDSITRGGPTIASGEGYVSIVHAFAVEGYDVTQAALRLADKPDFFVYYGFHVMPMTQFNALLYMLFPMDEKLFVGALAQRLEVEKNPKTQKALVLTLALTVTPEGNAALRNFVARKDISGDLRKEAEKRIAYKGHTHDASEAADAIRARRRAIAGRPIGHDFWNDFHEASEALMHKVQLP
jgi:hypothetical protein